MTYLVLECTLLGNKDDSWVMELLFKPGFHRYHLIEWILSKLGYDIGKMTGPQNSAEERMKNLQSTLSDLGICRQNSKDVIKGTAEIKQQVEFWCQLINIIWLKYAIATSNSACESDEGLSLTPEMIKTKSSYEEFEEATSLVNKICESVNLKHLFKHSVQLVSPDVQREIENLSQSKSEIFKIPSLEELKRNAKENSGVNVAELNKALSSNVSFNEDENEELLKLNQLEEELSNICAEFSNAESSFSSVYADLKPLVMHAKADSFTDVGPAFKKLDPSLQNLLQLKNSFFKLQSSNCKLLKINSDLEDLSSKDVLSDEKYTNILKLVKKEN